MSINQQAITDSRSLSEDTQNKYNQTNLYSKRIDEFTVLLFKNLWLSQIDEDFNTGLKRGAKFRTVGNSIADLNTN